MPIKLFSVERIPIKFNRDNYFDGYCRMLGLTSAFLSIDMELTLEIRKFSCGKDVHTCLVINWKFCSLVNCFVDKTSQTFQFFISADSTYLVD